MRLVLRELKVFPGYCGGHPVPVKGPTVESDTERVVALGKFGMYNSFVTRLLVRLDSGATYQVMGADQEPEAARWLRKRAAAFTDYPHTSRETGWSEVWEEQHA